MRLVCLSHRIVYSELGGGGGGPLEEEVVYSLERSSPAGHAVRKSRPIDCIRVFAIHTRDFVNPVSGHHGSKRYLGVDRV